MNDAEKAVRKAVKRAAKDERRRCCKVALDIAAQFDAMGFRHDADKAADAYAVLKALGGAEDTRPHTIHHVAGISPVSESW